MHDRVVQLIGWLQKSFLYDFRGFMVVLLQCLPHFCSRRSFWVTPEKLDFVLKSIFHFLIELDLYFSDILFGFKWGVILTYIVT